MPKRSRSGLVRRPGARGGADQRELREIDLDRARRRPLADDQVELEILHRRIEDLLDRRIEPVDLVDEQHVALLEIGEQRREVAGLGDHRPGGGAEIDAELARDDLRQRGLAEPGRADEQHVVERLVARPRRLDEDREIGARLLLADELGKPLRAQRALGRVLVAALGRSTRRRGVVLTAQSAPFVRGYICSAATRRSATISGPSAPGTITRALRS